MKVVITDYIVADIAYEKEQCQRMGAELWSYELKSAGPQELIQVVRDADVIVVNMAKLNEPVILGLERCQGIIRCGIGYDNVDVKTATRRGIEMVNIPDYCLQEVAEQTITLMMACQRRLTQQPGYMEQSIQAGRWVYDSVSPIYRFSGKTVGILGFGGIGKAVYRMLQGFGVNFLVTDPYLPEEQAKAFGIHLVPFEQLLQKSDIITIHVPLKGEETYHLFDTPQFEMMKPTATLINTSRGGIVNLEALDNALKKGLIAFAGIDVYEQEPPSPDLALLKNPNAICTPHLSWVSEESFFSLREKVFQNVNRFVKGQPRLHVVNAGDLSLRQANKEDQK